MKRSRIQEGGAHAQGVWCVLEARPYFRNTKTKRDAPPLYRREQPRDVNKNTTIFISKNIYKTTTFPFTCNSAQRRSLVRSTELGAQGRSEFQAYLFPHLKCNLCAPERSCPAKGPTRLKQTRGIGWNGPFHPEKPLLPCIVAPNVCGSQPRTRARREVLTLTWPERVYLFRVGNPLICQQEFITHIQVDLLHQVRALKTVKQKPSYTQVQNTRVVRLVHG